MSYIVYETTGHLIVTFNRISDGCFATRDGGWTGGRKGRRKEAKQNGGSEAGGSEAGGGEAERTPEEKKGGSESGRRKEQRVGPSNGTEE